MEYSILGLGQSGTRYVLELLRTHSRVYTLVVRLSSWCMKYQW